jgi:type I restriction enzyme S subunit
MNADTLLKHFDRISEAPEAIPRLRRFILDLAVRGKLMEQDLNDESATELLKQIELAKISRIKAGEIRAPRSLEWTDAIDELFAIPKYWRWVRLSEVGAIVGGGTPSSGDADNLTSGGTGIAWLTPADLGKFKGLYVSHGVRDLTDKGLHSSSATLMPKGSVLFTSRAPIGYTAIASNEITTNQGFKSVVPYISDCSRYIALYLQAFAPWIDSKASGTTFREVSGKIVSGLPFPLPPLAEQHRIVAKVDELMALCDQLQITRNERETRRNCLVASSLNRISTSSAEEAKDAARFHFDHFPRLTARTEHIKQLRQSILSLAVRGLLVPQDPNDEPITVVIDRIKKEKVHLVALGKIKFEKPLDLINLQKVPFDAPAGWAWRKIDTIVRSLRDDIRTGPFGSTLHKEEHRPTGVPVWGIESINKNGSFNGKCKIFVDAKKARELFSFAVKGGDIIISRSGTVGELCRLPDDVPHGLLSTNLMKISLDKEVVSPDYFCLLFKGAESIDTQLIELCAGSTRLFLTQSILAKLHFPLPPLAEQHRIVTKVNELMTLCDQLEIQLTSTEADNRRLLEAVLRDALETSKMLS